MDDEGKTEQVSGDGYDAPPAAAASTGVASYKNIRDFSFLTYLIFILISGGVGYAVFRVTPYGEKFAVNVMELTANFSVAIGAFVLAKGAVLSLRRRRWLRSVLKQEERTRTRFARRKVTYQYLLELAERLKAGEDITPVIVSLQESLRNRDKKVIRIDFSQRHNQDSLQRNWVYVISQKDIAEMMLDASDYAFWGTVFTGGGALAITLILAFSK